MSREQRIFTRVPFGQTVRWRDAQGESGAATVRDIGRGGFSVSLTQYLRPGPALVFTFDDVLYNEKPVELSALTVWCSPTAEAGDRFVGGFSVVHGEQHTLAAISEVFYAAWDEYAVGHVASHPG